MEHNGNAKDTPAEGAGELTFGAPALTKTRQPSGKIFRKKEAGWLSKARAEWMTGKRGKLTARRLRGEAAYDDLVEEELCWDLARAYARKSAERTGGCNGDIRDRYEEILLEFVRARSGGALIHDD